MMMIKHWAFQRPVKASELEVTEGNRDDCCEESPGQSSRCYLLTTLLLNSSLSLWTNACATCWTQISQSEPKLVFLIKITTLQKRQLLIHMPNIQCEILNPQLNHSHHPLIEILDFWPKDISQHDLSTDRKLHSVLCVINRLHSSKAFMCAAAGRSSKRRYIWHFGRKSSDVTLHEAVAVRLFMSDGIHKFCMDKHG